jgi:condensin complex subunit 3
MPAPTLPLKDTLFASLSKVFDQAQSSTANHQKNFVALYKLHVNAAEHVESVDNGRQPKFTSERLFEDAFLDLINRVLTIKKGVAVADRIVKFVGGYSKVLEEKCMSFPSPSCSLTISWSNSCRTP